VNNWRITQKEEENTCLEALEVKKSLEKIDGLAHFTNLL